ncbi:MAG: hypothetical protein WBC04_23420 [Candidatus Acidiferrales bacterium]
MNEPGDRENDGDIRDQDRDDSPDPARIFPGQHDDSLFMRYDIVKGGLGSETLRETFAKEQVRRVFSVVQSAIAVPEQPVHDLLLSGEGLGYAPAASTAHLRR